VRSTNGTVGCQRTIEVTKPIMPAPDRSAPTCSSSAAEPRHALLELSVVSSDTQLRGLGHGPESKVARRRHVSSMSGTGGGTTDDSARVADHLMRAGFSAPPGTVDVQPVGVVIWIEGPVGGHGISCRWTDLAVDGPDLKIQFRGRGVLSWQYFSGGCSAPAPDYQRHADQHQHARDAGQALASSAPARSAGDHRRI
jgi:hypothetical protein